MRGTLLRAVILSTLVAVAAQAQVEYDGVIFGRFNKYDYAPAHLKVGNVHHIWWCTESNSGDEIWYTKKQGNLGAGGWDPPIKVFGVTHSPWSFKHVCDPSVIRGSFPYNGTTYTYAMYYTSIPPLRGGSNDIGVAFSRTGINWTAYPQSIIKPLDLVGTQYGAGMSGVAWKPGTSIIQHVYFDSTQVPEIRLVEGTGGISFSPPYGVATQLDLAGPNADGQGPDIAFNPANQLWYAVIKNPDPNGIYDGETRILRATTPNSLTGGGWQVIGAVNSSLTGKPQNHNPGLGKNSDSTLHIDLNGWAYVFFGVGLERPATNTWEIGQARFRP